MLGQTFVKSLAGEGITMVCDDLMSKKEGENDQYCILMNIHLGPEV